MHELKELMFYRDYLPGELHDMKEATRRQPLALLNLNPMKPFRIRRSRTLKVTIMFPFVVKIFPNLL